MFFWLASAASLFLLSRLSRGVSNFTGGGSSEAGLNKWTYWESKEDKSNQKDEMKTGRRAKNEQTWATPVYGRRCRLTGGDLNSKGRRGAKSARRAGGRKWDILLRIKQNTEQRSAKEQKTRSRKLQEEKKKKEGRSSRTWLGVFRNIHKIWFVFKFFQSFLSSLRSKNATWNDKAICLVCIFFCFPEVSVCFFLSSFIGFTDCLFSLSFWITHNSLFSLSTNSLLQIWPYQQHVGRRPSTI